MNQVNNVLIVGGGIAGLTAAIALHDKGIKTDILEKNPEWSVYGVGIIQPSNLLRALKSLGLGEACLAKGFGFKGWEIFDAHDHKLGQVPGVNVAGDGYPPLNGITRPVLHKILTDAVLERDIPVTLGETVSAFAETEQGVSVTFSSGKQKVYDLVLGADGAYSKTRTQLFSNQKSPQFTGEGVWRYNLKKPAGMDWGSIHYGKSSKAGLVPLSDELMYLFLVTEEPGNPMMAEDKLDVLLRERMQEYTGFIAELREQITDPKQVVYRPMEVIAVPKPWHKGRVMLIGDAAHSGTPHLAEGAAMAIEDSVVLAEMLNSSSEPLQVTLERFVERRIHRTNLVYETGIALGELELKEWHGEHVDPTQHGQMMGAAYQELMKAI